MSVVIVTLILAYIGTLLLGASSSCGALHDRLYQHSGNFPAVGGP